MPTYFAFKKLNLPVWVITCKAVMHRFEMTVKRTFVAGLLTHHSPPSSLLSQSSLLPENKVIDLPHFMHVSMSLCVFGGKLSIR